MPDFIFNGEAQGGVASRLLSNNFSPNVLRPWIGSDGATYVANIGKDGKPYAQRVDNATATLRKDEWKLLDDVLLRVAKPRLRAFGDLRSAGLQFVIPNGMGKTVLEYEDQSDISPATISMDGLRRGESDRPVYELKSLPLPIVHKDFHYSIRQINASRNGGSPLDTTTAELATRRAAEEVEKLTLGTLPQYTYGGGTIYGYTNFPKRLTGDLSDPTDVGWTPKDTIQDVLAMRQQSRAKFHYGPWRLYNSPDWDQYLDEDYSDNKGDNTLRDRILKIDGIQSVSTLDYLEDLQFIMVQQSTDVARAVIGMEMTMVQWETQGGMEVNFKVMAILVPQLRADQNDNTGIVHRTVPAGTGS